MLTIACDPLVAIKGGEITPMSRENISVPSVKSSSVIFSDRHCGSVELGGKVKVVSLLASKSSSVLVVMNNQTIMLMNMHTTYD